jgi:2,3-diketo-5-methylthio-1-phosphopentane phosphatase
MRQQIALIRGGQEELDAVLDGAALDPGFRDFVVWAEHRGLPVAIVSDGVDYFISRILGRHGLGRLPVVANRLAGQAGAWRLEQPWTRAGCAAGSGVCKCDVTGPWTENRPTTIYVGDGRSDFCVSGRADLLFAKGALAEYAEARGQAFLPFETFHDVTNALARLTGELPADLDRAASL